LVEAPFYSALKRAEIENFRFHDLRHTFASYLAINGVDLLLIKELLGHKSIEMTLRYAHINNESKKRAVKALDGFYGTNMAQHPTGNTLTY